MKKLTLVVMAVALVAQAVCAGQAFVAPYFGGIVPFNSDDDEIEIGSGIGVGMRAGYHLDNAGIIGVFLDGNAQFPKIEEPIEGDTMMFSLSLNAMLRLPAGPVRPYFGAGFGVAAMRMDVSPRSYPLYDSWGRVMGYETDDVSGSDAGPMWDFFAGVEVVINDHFSAFGEFRYQQAYLEPSDYHIEYETGLAVVGMAYRW